MNNNLTKTSCKSCIFAVYEGKTQTGCDHGRIEKFGQDVIEAYDNDSEFYVINRLCNYLRSTNWNDGHKDLDKLKLESAVSFDIFIDVNNLSLENKEKISKTIKNLHYYSDKVKIFLFHDKKVKKDQRSLILSLFYDLNQPVLSVYDEKNQYLDSIIAKSTSTFHIILKNEHFDYLDETLVFTNQTVNENLTRFLLLQYKDITVISNMACKILYHKFYEDFDHQFKEMLTDAKKNQMFIEYQEKNQ